MSTVGKLSREEHRRQKDLDAARKAGTAPAEVDEEGRDINPHIPAFMAQAPWYLDSGRPSLRHQRKPEADEPVRADMNKWYARGQRAGPAATKYRAGACENCGAISHKTKDCLERPRKKGAKWTGKNIAADEVIVDIEGLDKDYDAKRDRWNGYDPSQHKKVVEQYEAVEEERRRLREEEIDQQTSTADLSTVKKLANKGKGKAVKKGADGEEGEGEDGDDQKDDDDDDFGSSDDEDEDEDKYADKANMPGQKIDTNKRITVRNLRIREDRAKYLYNLNPESAYYDPKTRSMREAPDASVRPEDAEFAGDNFARGQGDSVAMQKLQLFAWQAESRGNDLHLQANPTVNEIQYRQFQKKRDVLRESTKGSILEKYGGAEHFDSVPKELLTGQTENYVEYSRSGQVIKGAQRVKAKSKYDEDVYENNHTAVWGSWYDIGSAEWGYGCCHSTVPNSYCTGEAGIAAASSAGPSQVKSVAPAASSKRMESSSSGKQDQKKRRRSDSVSSYSSTGSSSASSDYDSEFDSDSDDSRRRRRRSSRSKRHSSSKHTKTSSSTKKQRRKAGKDGDDDPDGLKAAAAINEAGRNRSKFGKGDTDEVSEEQMEAYRRSQANKFEDPMANYRDEE